MASQNKMATTILGHSNVVKLMEMGDLVLSNTLEELCLDTDDDLAKDVI